VTIGVGAVFGAGALGVCCTVVVAAVLVAVIGSAGVGRLDQELTPSRRRAIARTMIIQVFVSIAMRLGVSTLRLDLSRASARERFG
jgi:MFS-type transporter involved in bile tolerance (Atg22 family)